MWKHIFSNEWIIMVLKLPVFSNILLVRVVRNVVLQDGVVLVMVSLVNMAVWDVQVESKVVVFVVACVHLDTVVVNWWLVSIMVLSMDLILLIVSNFIRVDSMVGILMMNFSMVHLCMVSISMVHICMVSIHMVRINMVSISMMDISVMGISVMGISMMSVSVMWQIMVSMHRMMAMVSMVYSMVAIMPWNIMVLSITKQIIEVGFILVLD